MAEHAAYEDKIILEDVSGASASIRYEGILRISGDVRDGASVTGIGGVEIMGSVRGSKIFSDGNITISGNVGGDEGSILKAGKILKAGSIENAAVVADTIICRGSIKNSRIHAYNLIEAISGEGEVSAAQCRAGNRFVSNILGTSGDRETLVEVEQADKNRFLRNLFAVEEEIKTAADELDRLQRVVKMVKLMGDKVRELDEAKQRDLREKLQRVVELQALLKELESRREILAGQVEIITADTDDFPVEVRKKTIRGSVIKIDGSVFELSESITTGAGFYKKKRILVKLF